MNKYGMQDKNESRILPHSYQTKECWTKLKQTHKFLVCLMLVNQINNWNFNAKWRRCN